MMTKKRESVLVALLVMLYLLAPISGYALTKLPDIGIDYRTMTVTQAVKLTAAGMKDAKNGDKIFMRTTTEGVFFFKNLRTNEELSYLPAKPKEKIR
jgi:hypothetical protein